MALDSVSTNTVKGHEYRSKPTTYLDCDFRQLHQSIRPSSHFPERWDDKDIKSNQCRRWVPRKRENRFPESLIPLDHRNSGKGGRFTGFDADSAKMDDSVEVSLDEWFKKVSGTH